MRSIVLDVFVRSGVVQKGRVSGVGGTRGVGVGAGGVCDSAAGPGGGVTTRTCP